MEDIAQEIWTYLIGKPAALMVIASTIPHAWSWLRTWGINREGLGHHRLCGAAAAVCVGCARRKPHAAQLSRRAGARPGCSHHPGSREWMERLEKGIVQPRSYCCERRPEQGWRRGTVLLCPLLRYPRTLRWPNAARHGNLVLVFYYYLHAISKFS